jgi:RNA polymerase sigma factor (sigma-70 family)
MAFAERYYDEPEMWSDEDPESRIPEFEQLLKRLSPTLKRITRKLNSNLAFMDDQDLFQEALVHLWTKFSSRDLDDKTDSYMLQGCYFHLKNHLRKNQDGPPLLSLNEPAGEDGFSLADVLPAQEATSLEKVEGKLQLEAITGTGVSEREKAVLFCSLEDMTTREIGQKLGISHVSVVKIRNKIKGRYEKIYGLCGAASVSATAN